MILADNNQAPAHNQALSASASNTLLDQLTTKLIADKKLTERELQQAQNLLQETNQTLCKLLLKLGFVSESDIAKLWSELLSVDLIEEFADDFTPNAADNLSLKFFRHAGVLPTQTLDDSITYAVCDPSIPNLTKGLELATNKNVEIKIATYSSIEQALDKFDNSASTSNQEDEQFSIDEDSNLTDDIERLRHLASETPIVRIVNRILQYAVDIGASDIHIEPFKDDLIVRYRVDGILQETEPPPVQSCAAVISRIKIMAKLDIAERRLPQDGRVQLRIQGKEIDLRVSTAPTLYGESVVMRVLDKSTLNFDFNALGFDSDLGNKPQDLLENPHGILLVTGPTGSGKTTTLYAALSMLNSPGKKIITVEDPIEYQLTRINQIQVKPQIDLTFANALRSIVRQDPDVIMIGEMRDLETAKIAVQSALTGHLVLSTLHTNDATSAITRLVDMGIDPYLVTSSVIGIVAQRLVRILCNECKQEYQPSAVVADSLLLKEPFDGSLYKAIGCKQCNHTGYHGRTVIYEMLTFNDEIRSNVMQQTDASSLHQIALHHGLVPIHSNGMEKVRLGITSMEEITRVTQEHS